jgi:hypothetical protein
MMAMMPKAIESTPLKASSSPPSITRRSRIAATISITLAISAQIATR